MSLELLVAGDTPWLTMLPETPPPAAQTLLTENRTISIQSHLHEVFIGRVSQQTYSISSRRWFSSSLAFSLPGSVTK
jgi:hypothetical protein